MKRFLLWSFERGSIQYDVICLVIFAFIFTTPQTCFDDRPDWMRIRAFDPVIHQTKDDDGKPVWVVKLKTEQDAVDRLKLSLGQDATIFRIVPVYDSYGALVQYAIWVAGDQMQPKVLSLWAANSKSGRFEPFFQERYI